MARMSASVAAPRTFVGGRAAAPTQRFGASTRGLVAAARPSYARASRRGQVIECKKVAVLGAAGGIGQPLALLLKMNKLVTELSLYDIQGTPGVAADLSHCNTPVKVRCRCKHSCATLGNLQFSIPTPMLCFPPILHGPCR